MTGDQPASKEELASFLETFSLDHAQLSLDTFAGLAPKTSTRVERLDSSGISLPVYVNEFWTAKQRQSSSIHEVSYRGCFKAQLPAFFITMLTRPGDVVYDPFAGRGTTIIEAALLGRNVVANDVNPLSRILIRPRLEVPDLDDVRARLAGIPVDPSARPAIDLSMFYHEGTAAEIESLKRYLDNRAGTGQDDAVDRWIRMVATNRLTGHSPGFFSVYTLPPNQAVSPERQEKINQKRKQVPPYREVKRIIARKTVSLLKDITGDIKARLRRASTRATFTCGDARHVPSIPDASVSLVVTSPPFLSVVQYAKDNWLRCWFNSIDAEAVGERITMARTVDEWTGVMGEVFTELHRITAPGGWVAFEVGEVGKGEIKLEEHVVPLGINAGFEPFGVVINEQAFTKTSNIWGVDNNARGTNTNRIVLFQKA